ncbi:16S rRNA (cytosine(1402)-N(4))-methyltransferase RsmH [Candidatus Saccharibacteria bacterium]|nr:16S rRNA (cytosine(1402)-N(4))-methyltransferase RsmH [Candidatus Saccharibacteria bacterium]
MEELHRPVLLSEVLATLKPQAGETYLDLTAGYAGHASRILDVTRNYKGSVLVDRDDFAIEFLRAKYKSEAVKIVKSDFYSAALQFLQCGKTFDMILLDLGVSSPQLDRGERGFSFSNDGPLDMRMDREQTLTAAVVVNEWREREIAQILMDYGEESEGLARKHARIIAGGRPWTSTKELADAIGEKKGRIHPATRVFQAIRIAVNDELSLLEKTLPLLPKLLSPGGRLGLITFHSLEDRMVKRYFKEASSLGKESELELITKRPIIGGQVELVINPRARSAKLRACKRP